ncbi:hypothetical protein tinsulaeT_04270 [Thalassotalea insulae]|uniref:Uncharacterized protein n=1 Tax=Thalassotalea insulae TaxID=2056778 RepID=A0ABQ6GR78_9GAMM|nr:DUF6559 family protein [Thalassotalea insulae]GLX77087.1 hypothetical protein tinsulaeT_04270 [Thalassotalea insulae]
MFTYWSLKKYGNKLLPQLIKHYGQQAYYSPSQIRTIVYRKDFNPKFLPLGYILFAAPEALQGIMAKEFPQINIADYKREILSYLEGKSYSGYLQVLQ